MSPSYDNAPTQVRRDLEHVAAAAGGVDGLIPMVEEAGLELIRSTALLDEATQHTLVSTKILDGSEYALDDIVPWGRALEVHGRVHLPAHTQQLAALRAEAKAGV